jgi:hypothetical protein
MPILEFKDKTAKHEVFINGKFVRLQNGKAEISELDAQTFIKSPNTKGYKVLEDKQEEPEKPKKKPRAKKKD